MIIKFIFGEQFQDSGFLSVNLYSVNNWRTWRTRDSTTASCSSAEKYRNCQLSLHSDINKGMKDPQVLTICQYLDQTTSFGSAHTGTCMRSKGMTYVSTVQVFLILIWPQSWKTIDIFKTELPMIQPLLMQYFKNVFEIALMWVYV